MRELPARGRLQVPRGLQRGLPAHPDQLSRGIAAYSSGNHAQAVALAARKLGTTAVIVMPEDAPPSKRAATEGYGAEIVTYDRYSGDRVAVAEALAAERGLTLVPPYEHPHVIAGQGTAALELVEEAGSWTSCSRRWVAAG